MTLFDRRRVTEPPSRKSHGLQDIYQVPASFLKVCSPPVADHLPQPLRVKKTNGQKRAKPKLRLRRKPDSRKLHYKQTRNISRRTHDDEHKELALRRQYLVQENEQVQPTPEGRAYEIEHQLDGMPEVAKKRLMEIALEGLFATGDLSSVENGGGNASSVREKEKSVAREATLPIEHSTVETLGNTDSNTASVSFETCVGNEEFNTMQCQEALIFTLEKGRLANEKDIPEPTLYNAIAAPELFPAPQIESLDMNISAKARSPLSSRVSNECGQNIDIVARVGAPYPASLLETAIELKNLNNADAQMPQTSAEAFHADIYMPGDSRPDGLDIYAIDTNIIITDIGSDERRIEAIEDLRMNEDGHTDFLVKWEGIDYELATWEHEETVISSAPRLLIQYLKYMIFADSRIEQAEKDKEVEWNQLSTDRFPENDASLLENNSQVLGDNSMKDGQVIGDDDTIDDSQSFREGECTGDEQPLRLETALECKPLGPTATPVGKRGQGRPRKIDKNTMTTRVSRRTTTVTVNHFETLGASIRDGFGHDYNISSESQSKPSERDFSMPSAEGVLEAARELALSRGGRKSITRKTRHRQQHLVNGQKTSMPISSSKPGENPYKKYYLTGRSNRILKSQRATRSQLRRAPRGGRLPPRSSETEIKKANETLRPGITVVRRRRGRPPGSRNSKNITTAQTQCISSSPMLRSGGIRKTRSGQPRIRHNKGDLFSSLRSSSRSKDELEKGRGRLRAGRCEATLIELDSIFDQVSNLSRL